MIDKLQGELIKNKIVFIYLYKIIEVWMISYQNSKEKKIFLSKMFKQESYSIFLPKTFTESSSLNSF